MHPKMDVAGLLRNTPFFNGLSDSQLFQIQQGTSVVRAKKGDILFLKGDQPTGLYHLVFGQVKTAFPSVHGSEKVLQILDKGHHIGEVAALLNCPYPVYAQCLTDSLILHISAQTITNVITQEPALALHLLQDISERLLKLMQDVEAFSQQTTQQRVIHYLLDLTLQQQNMQQASQIRLPTTKGVLASRLSLKPETLSRIFHQLVTDDLISVKGRQIQIHDINRLKQII